MGYIFDFENAKEYERWFQEPRGKQVLSLEKYLLRQLVKPLPGERLLEVGCGTGIFLEWFRDLGYFVTGLEPSPYMLDIARHKLGSNVSLYRGTAEDLPFDDNEYDVVAIITTLEFVDDPPAALHEAIRVARKKLIVGALNRYSFTNARRWVSGILKSHSIYSHARFFSVFELKRMITSHLQNSPISWRTVLFTPNFLLPYFCWLERSRYFQYNPFGAFIGVSVDIKPTFHTVQQPIMDPLHSSSGNISPKPTFYGKISELPQEKFHERSQTIRQIN